MLRIRAKSGKTITMEEPLMYVEILDSDDNVSMVFYREVIAGANAVTLITPDTESADTYSKLYNIEWSKNLKTDWQSELPLEFSST